MDRPPEKTFAHSAARGKVDTNGENANGHFLQSRNLNIQGANWVEVYHIIGCNAVETNSGKVGTKAGLGLRREPHGKSKRRSWQRRRQPS